MPYVERAADGSIKGLYARDQGGRVSEFLPETHPDVAAFRARPPAMDPERELSAEELYDILKTKGVVADGDRPRPRPPGRQPA